MTNLQAVFKAIGEVGVVAHWISGLGQLDRLAGHAMETPKGSSSPTFYLGPLASIRSQVAVSRPREVVPQFSPAVASPFGDLRFDPLGVCAGSTFDPVSASMDLFLGPTTVGSYSELLGALAYVSEHIAVEHSITANTQGSYTVYRGDESSVANSPFNVLFLHTHGDGIALPSLQDFVCFFDYYKGNKTYHTLIYSKPTHGHEISFVKPLNCHKAEIWHWQDKEGKLRARCFIVELIPRSGQYPDLVVQEVSSKGEGREIIASHSYSASEFRTAGSEQDFWKKVLDA